MNAHPPGPPQEPAPQPAAPVPPPLAATRAAAPPAMESGEACPNCGAATWGEFCFACGQPKKGLIRRFTSILGDFLDTVFSIDNRLLRTIGPLYLKPGHLTLEYIAGRRVRYVTPFRLFFFLCVLSFLALKIYAANTEGAINFGEGDQVRIESALTDAEVDARLAEALEGLAKGREGLKVGLSAANAPQASISRAEENMAEAEQDLREAAVERKAWIAEVAKARAEGREPPEDPAADLGELEFGDGPWHPETNPLRFDWLPEFANDALNKRIGRAREALRHGREDPQPLIEAFFGAIPPTTFVLVPLFALLLKGLYLFKRRLYMEHLLATLHTHAFIFLSLLLLVVAQAVGDRLDPARTFWRDLLDWLSIAMAWWVPLYLFIAQKRIYRQGWIMTTLKWSVAGVSYLVLLGFGFALAVVFGMLSI
jgi:hypothetical protein